MDFAVRRFIAGIVVALLLYWGWMMLGYYRRMHKLLVAADAYGTYARHGGYWKIHVDVDDERCPPAVQEQYLRYRRLSLRTAIIGFVVLALSIYPINEYLLG